MKGGGQARLNETKKGLRTNGTRLRDHAICWVGEERRGEGLSFWIVRM
jgi:hypothetical protein